MPEDPGGSGMPTTTARYNVHSVAIVAVFVHPGRDTRGEITDTRGEITDTRGEIADLPPTGSARCPLASRRVKFVRPDCGTDVNDISEIGCFFRLGRIPGRPFHTRIL